MQLESAVKAVKRENASSIKTAGERQDNALQALNEALQQTAEGLKRGIQQVASDVDMTADTLAEVQAEVQDVAATTEAVVEKAASEIWAGVTNLTAKQELDIADVCNLLHESEQDMSELLQQLDHGICRRMTDVTTPRIRLHAKTHSLLLGLNDVWIGWEQVESRVTKTMDGRMGAMDQKTDFLRASLQGATMHVAETLDSKCSAHTPAIVRFEDAELRDCRDCTSQRAAIGGAESWTSVGRS